MHRKLSVEAGATQQRGSGDGNVRAARDTLKHGEPVPSHTTSAPGSGLNLGSGSRPLPDGARDQSLTWSADVGEGNTSDSVAWSPDGSRVAAGDGTGAVRFFDAANGEARGVPLEGHAGPSVTTSFSPDGTLLATSGTDGRVIVRDAGTGRQLGVPLAASDNAYTMAIFDPDGRLFVASADGSMWLWEMNLDSWLERACLTAGRGLSRDEWSDLDTGRDYEPACP